MSLQDVFFEQWDLEPNSSLSGGIGFIQGGRAEYTLHASRAQAPYREDTQAEFVLSATLPGLTLGTPVSLTFSFPGLPGSDTGLIKRDRFIRARDLNVSGFVLDVTGAASVAGLNGQILVFDRPMPTSISELWEVRREILRDIRMKRPSGCRALGWCLSHVMGFGAGATAYSAFFSVREAAPEREHPLAHRGWGRPPSTNRY